MRISTNMMYTTSTNQLSSLQSQLARTQQQLSSNKRMLSAADDPIAAARALEVTQSQSINAQYATNRQNARSALSQEEVALTGVQQLIQDVQVIAVAAAGGANNNSDRTTYANELQGRLEDLMSLANSSDGNGGYVFSGYQSNTVPFVKTSQGVDYHGDQGQAQLQIAASRKVAIGDSGSSVFTNLPTGNGNFVTGAGGTNTGGAVISAGTVADARQLTGHAYSIDFTVVPAVPGTPEQVSYVITDTTMGVTVPPAPAVASVPYTSGQPILVGGMKFEVTGTPANTDNFSVKPSERQSLFQTLSKMIDTLRAPANTDVEKKAMTAGLAEANGNLSTALDNVLTVRSSVGSRMKEFDTLDLAGDDADIQYTATLQDLEGLDVLKAITQFSQQKSSLEAAQMSFKTISSLSLFNYIR
ncbi:flagellar hook-associated protein 3 [Massilia eurypsychrophila]|uniref:Flagellar hook-associated protein 3 n=1 Tax=Massilia eurypsychrophila TaxID=1485217 RepID=A0A2G8TBM1_9BURK|nr:flagellar hook-associated protein FlgL [Massilia eurypsychrophila]PIL43450.1 flagellar hook-associated protein 3 [Massilia eurypsychrophila]